MRVIVVDEVGEVGTLPERTVQSSKCNNIGFMLPGALACYSSLFTHPISWLYEQQAI
jgi:hypothetical protein